MIAKPKSSGSGSSSSGSKTTYITTTVSDADHAASADKATRAENADRATYADRTGTAQNAAYATVAGSLSKDAEVLDDYLYKGETEETQEVKGKVTFDDTITAKTEILAQLLQSLDYSNAAEQGFSIEKEDSGKYHEYITNLTVWGKAVFHELEIRKLSYAGGNIYLSGAGSKLVKVVPVVWDSESSSWTESTDADCEGWKCYLLADDGTTATQNYWQEGDQVKCQTFGQITSAGTYSDASNKAYWRTIPASGISTANEKIYDSDGNELYNGQQFAWIVIGKHSESLDGYTEDSAPTETKDYPAAGDTIVLDGNRHRGDDGNYDKTDRQNIIILETTGDDAPRIVGYHNINEYSHSSDNYVFLFSAKEGVTLNSSCFKWTTSDGSEINMSNYCGDWTEGTTYHKNDQVSHNNAVWICVANSGVDVTDEPSDTSSNWKKVLSGGKGDKGDSGDGVVMAYKNADTQPSKPTVTDLSQLASEGWSRTPYGSIINKVDNITYGSFSVGQGTNVLSDTEWSDIIYGGYTWKRSPSGLSDYYGYAIMKVSFTTNVDNVDVLIRMVANSETDKDGIVLFALDSEISPTAGYDPFADGAYKGVFVSGPNVSKSSTYHVEKAGEHYFYVSYYKNNSGSGGIQVSYGTDCALFRIDLSGNQIASSSSITWMSQAILRNEQAVLPWSDPVKITGEDGAQGANGNDGNDGKSALEIIVSPDTIVFDTNESGIVGDYSSNSATISCYRESSLVSNIDYSFATNGCGAKLSSVNGVITVRITSIYTDTVSGTTYKVSKTSGTVDVSITDLSTGTTYKAQVKFAVNVSKFTGGIMADNKKFETVYNELTNSGNTDALTLINSKIAQTAREISLEVSQKTVGRRNLLVGSAARKYGEGWTYMSGGSSYGGAPVERIEINSGIDGTNCLHCYGSSSYAMGFRWYGLSPQGNIKLEKGKTYTLSCYVKTNAAGYVKFYLETHMMSSATATSRSYSNYHDVTKYIDYSDTWTRITNTFTMSESYEYAEICIFAYPTSGARDIYFCRPMLEEGDTANGWTLSEQDYDYVGGNLLDNTRTLTVGDNLKLVGALSTDEEGVAASTGTAPKSNSFADILRFENLSLKANTDYVLSYYIKSTSGGTNYVSNLLNLENNVLFAEYEGGTSQLTLVEGASTYSGNIDRRPIPSQWTRVWYHFRLINDATAQVINITTYGYGGSGSISVKKPKLEEGATLTEWTERKADLIDKASLKAAGISISSSEVELYGDQIKVSSTKGGTPTALFKDGKVTASHIDVDDLMAQTMTAQNLTVTGSSKFGIWEIDSDDTYGSAITTKQCTINGTSYLGSVLRYTPLFVRGGSTASNAFVKVGPYVTEFSGMNGGYYNGIFLGYAAGIVCQGATNEWNLPTEYAFSQDYRPTAYIYAKKAVKEDPALAIKMQYANYNATYTAIATNGAVRSVLAPNVQIIPSGTTFAVINTGIGIVICRNSAGLTLTLPPNPVSGQMLQIISQTDSMIYIKANGISIMGYGSSSEKTQVKCGKRGQFNWFVYDGTYWNCIFTDGAL